MPADSVSTYERRVHRVMDHIRRNLGTDLSLEALARIAEFSPFHFHRIFRAMTGETVATFTTRARLERAVYLMRGAPKRELTSIALEVGFGTPSDFSRVFRKVYGCAPSSWDREARLDGASDYVGADRSAPEPPPLTARIVDRPPCRLLYIRVRDPWTGTNLAEGYGRLFGWLADQRLDPRQRQLVGLSWDSDRATPLDRLVYDLGLTIEADEVDPGEEFGVHELPAVRAVEIHCTSLRATAFAWDFLYTTWLPASRFEPADLPAAKRFRRVPDVWDASAWDVDCSIALRDRVP